MQYGLGSHIGLGQHGRSGLGQNLVLGEVGHLLSHIRVTDPALRSTQVFNGNAQVVDGMLHPVLEGAQVVRREVTSFVKSSMCCRTQQKVGSARADRADRCARELALV